MAILKLALLGKELSHSLSPALHEQLFRIFKNRYGLQYLDIQYDLVECEEECDLAQWLKTASTNGYAGANITYPFKARSFGLADKKIGVSSFIDSANCIRIYKDTIECASTDGAGLLFS